jgi:hypothetical protein
VKLLTVSLLAVASQHPLDALRGPQSRTVAGGSATAPERRLSDFRRDRGMP